MRELYRDERAAMWLYHTEYAAQREGAIEFYKRLSEGQKRIVDEMVTEILKAKPRVED